MATLYITEFFQEGWDGAGREMPVAQQVPVAEQTRSISGSSAQSSALNARTTLVRLHTDAICSVSFGTNPTASSSSMRMPADSTEYFSVPAGCGYKIAAITNS